MAQLHQPTELEIELVARAKRVGEARVSLARRFPGVFNEFVLKNEQTGQPVLNAPHHWKWHQILDENRRVSLLGHIENGKTNQISIGRVLWELGKNPDLRVCVVSATEKQTVKILSAIKGYIERSDELHRVFPELVPSNPWTQTHIRVRRTSHAKDPSIQVVSVNGNVIGSRLDLVVADDIISFDNSATPLRRNDLERWWHANITGRQTRQSRLWALGTAWFVDDQYHRLGKKKGFIFLRFPVANEDGEPNWPEVWPKERIAEMREELGPTEAARQLDVQARADDDQRVDEDWIEACLKQGAEYDVLTQLTEEEIPEGAFAVTGVDLGVKKTKKSAKTVVFTYLQHVDERGHLGKKQLLEIRSGKWRANEIMTEILSAQRRFHSLVMVEDNGAQDFIIQLIEDDEALKNDPASVHIRPHHTGGNKMHPVLGVEGVFADLSKGIWVIPSVEDPNKPGTFRAANEEIEQWLNDIRLYDPNAHTGDHLMASWIASSGGRKQHQKPRREMGIKIIGEATQEEIEARPELEGWKGFLRARRGVD